jgi:uncharacterized membrane protein
MRLSRKVAEWRTVGLIDALTADRILAHEAARSRPMAAWTLAGLGALTVGIGIISVIAANWDGIADSVKLSVDVAIAACLALGVGAMVLRGASWGRELLVLVYYLFTLASIALVGQVYQLGSPMWVALLAWTISTAPLLLVAKRAFVAAIGVAGLVLTHAHLVEPLSAWMARSHAGEDEVVLGVILASPLVYVCLAAIPWLARERPAHAAMLRLTAWTGVLVGGALAGFAWYISVGPGDLLRAGHIGGAASVIGFAVLAQRLHPNATARVRRAMVATWAVAWAIAVLSTSFPRQEVDVLAPVSHLVFLATVGWLALLLGRTRAFHVCTALAALRILVAYFEVFGSMLDTGLAMITGGTLTVALAWLWRKNSEAMERRLTEALTERQARD